MTADIKAVDVLTSISGIGSTFPIAGLIFNILKASGNLYITIRQSEIVKKEMNVYKDRSKVVRGDVFKSQILAHQFAIDVVKKLQSTGVSLEGDELELEIIARRIFEVSLISIMAIPNNSDESIKKESEDNARRIATNWLLVSQPKANESFLKALLKQVYEEKGLAKQISGVVDNIVKGILQISNS